MILRLAYQRDCDEVIKALAHAGYTVKQSKDDIKPNPYMIEIIDQNSAHISVEIDNIIRIVRSSANPKVRISEIIQGLLNGGR